MLDPGKCERPWGAMVSGFSADSAGAEDDPENCCKFASLGSLADDGKAGTEGAGAPN